MIPIEFSMSIYLEDKKQIAFTLEGLFSALFLFSSAAVT